MGRGSPVCQQIREKIIEMFKNNVPQRKIGRDLDISPSTVHNIIKRFKESGGISVHKGQGRKPNCAFTPQAARASKWPEVIHFQCEPAASSGESGAASFGR